MEIKDQSVAVYLIYVKSEQDGNELFQAIFIERSYKIPNSFKWSDLKEIKDFQGELNLLKEETHCISDYRAGVTIWSMQQFICSPANENRPTVIVFIGHSNRSQMGKYQLECLVSISAEKFRNLVFIAFAGCCVASPRSGNIVYASQNDSNLLVAGPEFYVEKKKIMLFYGILLGHILHIGNRYKGLFPNNREIIRFCIAAASGKSDYSDFLAFNFHNGSEDTTKKLCNLLQEVNSNPDYNMGDKWNLLNLIRYHLWTCDIPQDNIFDIVKEKHSSTVVKNLLKSSLRIYHVFALEKYYRLCHLLENNQYLKKTIDLAEIQFLKKCFNGNLGTSDHCKRLCFQYLLGLLYLFSSCYRFNKSNEARDIFRSICVIIVINYAKTYLAINNAWSLKFSINDGNIIIAFHENRFFKIYANGMNKELGVSFANSIKKIAIPECTFFEEALPIELINNCPELEYLYYKRIMSNAFIKKKLKSKKNDRKPLSPNQGHHLINKGVVQFHEKIFRKWKSKHNLKSEWSDIKTLGSVKKHLLSDVAEKFILSTTLDIPEHTGMDNAYAFGLLTQATIQAILFIAECLHLDLDADYYEYLLPDIENMMTINIFVDNKVKVEYESRYKDNKNLSLVIAEVTDMYSKEKLYKWVATIISFE